MSTRWFCHISEFGGEKADVTFEGAALLPVMLFLSKHLTLFAPSARQFSEAFTKGESLLAPEDLLELVQRHRIQIVGRRAWLTSPASRMNSNWKHAPWMSEFDDPIAEMALADELLPLWDRRVVLADPEDGWAWADKQLAAQSDHAITARALLARKELPPGFIEKAGRYSTLLGKKQKETFTPAAKAAQISLPEWLRVRSVLRDARNHEEAIKLTGSDLPVEPSKHVEAIPAIMGQRSQRGDAKFGLPQNAQLTEFLKIAASLSRPRNAQDLEKLLEREDRDDLIREMTPFMSNPNAALELHRQMKQNPPSWFSVLNPVSGQTRLKRALKLIGFAGLISEIVGIRLAPEAVVGLAISVIEYSKEIAERASWIPTSEYDGPKFPAVLAYDRTVARFSELNELGQRLLKPNF